jgi:hypothetical protein
MIYVTEDLFRWVVDIEKEILARTIFSANAIIMLKDTLRHVTIDLVTEHKSMIRFKHEITRALESTNSLSDTEIESYAQKIVVKFIDFYINIAMNDGVNYNYMKLRENYDTCNANLSFRKQVQVGSVDQKLKKALDTIKKLDAKEKKRKEEIKKLKESEKKRKEEKKAKDALEKENLKCERARKQKDIDKAKANKATEKANNSNSSSANESLIENINQVCCDGCDVWFHYPKDFEEAVNECDKWFCHYATWGYHPEICPALANADSNTNDVSDGEDDDEEDEEDEENGESEESEEN